MLKDNFFNFYVANGNSYVRYFLYKDDTVYGKTRINFPELITVTTKDTAPYIAKGFVENSNKACFASLVKQLGLYKDNYVMPNAVGCNRIVYYPNFYTTKGKYEITDDVIRKWYTLCKKYDLLPKYFNIEDAVKNRAVVFDLQAQSLNMLYIYLCMVRFLAAEPTYVHSVLRMCCTYKINFVVALVFFAHANIQNLNHHFIFASTSYMKPKSVFDLTVDVGTVAGIYRIIKNKGFLTEDAKTHAKGNHGFCANEIIKNLSPSFKISAKNIRSSHIPKLIKLDKNALEEKLKTLKLSV